LDFDARRFAAANEDIVAAKPYLKWTAEKAASYDRALRTLGEPHIGQAFANFFVENDA